MPVLLAPLETAIGTLVCGVLEGELVLLEFADPEANQGEGSSGARALAKIPDLGRQSEAGKLSIKGAIEEVHPLHEQTRIQLEAYFAGSRKTFELPFRLIGTEFQRRVWHELLRIPYGDTRTYGELARALGDPDCVRAVGMANGANRLAIVVPCHRVIGADGSLTGYAGGLWRKKRLLELEQGQTAMGL